MYVMRNRETVIEQPDSPRIRKHVVRFLIEHSRKIELPKS